LKCLIVEDDITTQRFLEYYLSDHADCSIATDGQKAVEIFRGALLGGEPYDLVCLDLVLPRTSGRQVLQKLRAVEQEYRIDQGSAAKVIVTTALADQAEAAKAFEQGCDAYLVKPVKRHKLLAELERLGLYHSNKTHQQ